MLAAIDLHLISGVGVAFQARRAQSDQLAAQRAGRVVQPCGAAEVEHAQGLGAGIAGLVDKYAAALHFHFDFNHEIGGACRGGHEQTEQRRQRASLHLVILQRRSGLTLRVAAKEEPASSQRNV
ncbi:hypothetical protein D9M70_637330 [compost metagenome]